MRIKHRECLWDDVAIFSQMVNWRAYLNLLTPNCFRNVLTLSVHTLSLHIIEFFLTFVNVTLGFSWGDLLVVIRRHHHYSKNMLKHTYLSPTYELFLLKTCQIFVILVPLPCTYVILKATHSESLRVFSYWSNSFFSLF